MEAPVTLPLSLAEANFDGIVGPTHNYAGLSYGNVASLSNEGSVSNPREAAKQGFTKAAFVASLGIVQGFLPPHERPHVPTLRALGFSGSDADVIAAAVKEDPILFARTCSASAMWTANAATVAPSCDALDGKVHFTAANLRSMMHRSIEPPTTARALKAIFGNDERFVHHSALPQADLFGDEGAANHTRLFGPDGRGLHFFVYGRSEREEGPKRFPARQTLAASQAIARLHRLDPARCVFARQRAESIDAGVFHNDVISVGNGHVLLTHEFAFADQAGTLAALKTALPQLVVVTVRASDVSVEQAVKSYLFNSQLVSVGAGGAMAIIAPTESHDDPAVKATLDRIVADPSNPIQAVHFQTLRESMRNGGGPACLRLRVPLTDAERAAANQAAFFTPSLHATLNAWADRHYRTELRPADLADPKLLDESRAALDELTRILKLGSIYEFQR
ncbi:MAG: N-succinylarginine dihydrolase [Phycisphaerae bacterium]|nr:N-succinylarginine dihydrolase [Phycisphaerae bacterium]